MENGVQALKIAASVLIFVIAITIAISAFSSATQALNRIFNMQNEDEYVTSIDKEGNEYYYNFTEEMRKLQNESNINVKVSFDNEMDWE